MTSMTREVRNIQSHMIRTAMLSTGVTTQQSVEQQERNLKDTGFPQEDIFYDELSISTGQVIRDRIMSALASNSMEVVVIVASKSLLNHKYWPKLELETALRHNKRLYPIWLDDNQDSFKEFSSLVDMDAAMEIVVASIISDEWRTLLHHLGLSEQELETLQNKETPEVACEAGLKLWRETRGQEVTKERLVRAVKDTKVKLRTGTEDPPSHGGQSPPMCPAGQGAAHTADTQQVEPMDTQDSPTVSFIPGQTGSDCMEESVHPAVVHVPENQWSEPIEVKVEPMDAELDAAFEVVSKDLWSDWERLAHTMGFSQSDVEDIKAGSPDQRYEQCWKLLYRWRDREGEKATLQALMQQLRMAGFHGIAEKLDIEDLSDQDGHGASKKNWDDSEASSDSDSDGDDDDSMKGTAPPTKMRPLKMGKRAVLDPPWTTGVKKKKKMEEDGDVEMVEEAGVSTNDNIEQAEVATDDLSFMLTPANIKRWQEAMKTHVVPDSRASLEEQFRFNMLVMHLIKDEVELSHKCKVLYSVQTDGGESPHRIPLDLTCAGNITENLQALAAVLPVGHRVQQADVEELKLRWTDIGDEGVRLLAEMFCYFPSLKHLDLSSNMITSTGATAVAAHMSHLQQLEWLDLSNNVTGEVNLSSWPSSYVYLLGVYNNKGNRLTVRTCHAGFVSLVDQMFSQVYRVELSCWGKVLYSVQTDGGENPHRMILDLTCAGNITENLQALAAVLPVGHRVQQADVEELKLGRTVIRDEEVRLLAEMFCYFPKLKHLGLSSNMITSTGATAVAAHMSHLQQLEWLDLSDDVTGEVNLSSWPSSYVYLLGVYNNKGNRLTVRTCHAGVVSLVDQMFSQVYRVELSHKCKVLYSVQTDGGENPHKMTLDLTCAGNITENLQALAAVLPVGHRVQQADVEELKLGRTDIGDEGARLLAEMLCYFPSLKHLDLSTNRITSKGATAMASHMSHLQQLEWFSFCGNNIGDYGVTALADNSCFIPKLKHLDLSYNGITSTGATAVAAHVPHLQQLEWLDLSGNGIGEVGVTAMYEKLDQLEKLKYLDLTMKGVSAGIRKSLLLTLSNMEHFSEVNLSTRSSSYVYLLGVYNNKGNRLTVKTGYSGVVSLVDQVFSQVYRVDLSCRGKVLYSVQTDGGENPHKMTLDLTCAGNITENLQALAAVLPVGHRVQQADVEELKLGRTVIRDEEVRLLAEMFCYFPSLKHLDLSSNMITSTGATAMAAHMSHLQQLEWLDLSDDVSVDQMFSQVFRVELSHKGKVLYSVQTDGGESPHSMTLDLTCAGNIAKNLQALAAVLPVGHRVQQADVEELKLGMSLIGYEGVPQLWLLTCHTYSSWSG
ncbi:RANGAP1 [Branchiostoma lanceolatum]|uniref:RANGAP1 protein n=1 Tax=Branchiostoma lanceolatum TaxID=7740 RepID=A0A8J9ZMC3_BRALA|nr:RANGAP1 [Branchiostoma lanceolatum]